MKSHKKIFTDAWEVARAFWKLALTVSCWQLKPTFIIQTIISANFAGIKTAYYNGMNSAWLGTGG